jgi:hypothetical protein
VAAPVSLAVVEAVKVVKIVAQPRVVMVLAAAVGAVHLLLFQALQTLQLSRGLV